MKCKKLISGIVAIMLVAVLAFGSTAAAVGAQTDNGADLALASQNVSELSNDRQLRIVPRRLA